MARRGHEVIVAETESGIGIAVSSRNSEAALSLAEDVTDYLSA